MVTDDVLTWTDPAFLASLPTMVMFNIVMEGIQEDYTREFRARRQKAPATKLNQQIELDMWQCVFGGFWSCF